MDYTPKFVVTVLEDGTKVSTLVKEPKESKVAPKQEHETAKTKAESNSK